MRKKKVNMKDPGRKKMQVKLKEVGEEVKIEGKLVAKDPGEYFLEIGLDHQASETKGEVEMKVVAEKKVVVRVVGLLKIVSGLKKVESFVRLKGLLLSENASIDFQPRLEIESKDVQVGHSAVLTKVDEQQMGYLMSRGLREEEARSLLVEGFIGEKRVE